MRLDDLATQECGLGPFYSVVRVIIAQKSTWGYPSLDLGGVAKGVANRPP